jgi:hypothetical protein
MKSFAVLLLVTLAVCKPTVYMIRHGEKPDDDGTGLSTQGQQRAQCLRSVFGASSQYNIGYILAQEYKSSESKQLIDRPAMATHLHCVLDGKRERPYDTVLPVATDLGLTVDTSCDRDDSKCVKKAVKNYSGSGNILIWYVLNLTSVSRIGFTNSH